MSPVTGGDIAAYGAANHHRRELVRGHPNLNGIDWIEVEPDQTTIRVHLLNPLGRRRVHPAPTRENIVIAGGVRVTGIVALSVRAEVRMLVVTVDRPGDWSTYELRIVDPASEEFGQAAPLAGFDPVLSSMPFSFKAGCPTGLDPPESAAPADQAGPEPVLDYLSKDYNSFVQLMSDRMATTLADWVERNPADLTVTLIELLAYVADHLSYYQDAIAAEAYMFTARRRVSLRRHARLLGYRVSEGCSARVFLSFCVSQPVTIPAGTTAHAEVPSETAPIFATMHDLAARPEHNGIPLHDWSDENLCLAPGSTSATLKVRGDVRLVPGMFLLLEQCPGDECPEWEAADPGACPDFPRTPLPDPDQCQVVRLTNVTHGVDPVDESRVIDVTWDTADALTFPLWVSGNRALARANIALADHGEPISEGRLVGDLLAPAGAWRPKLAERPLTFAQPYDPTASASALLSPDPTQAVPKIELHAGGTTWTPVYDLLGCSADAPNFVVEVESDRGARLRFGDGVNGRLPGGPLPATYRRGCGAPGNVNAGAITRLVGGSPPGVTSVVNPMPATGGQEPESINHLLRVAPHAHLDEQRAVTEDDFAALARSQAQVTTAACRLRWTGSWYTSFVTVQRVGGGSLESDSLAHDLARLLDSRRMAGVDVQLEQPVAVPVELALEVCVTPGFIAAKVKRRVFDQLTAATLPGGGLGFFHPDHFTMGQPVYLSAIYAAVLAVDGVDAVRATVFQRYGDPASSGLETGRIPVGPLEVVRLDQDLSLPDRGVLSITTRGGL